MAQTHKLDMNFEPGESSSCLASGHFKHAMPIGAEVQEDGTVRFRVWSDEAALLRVELDTVSEPLAMVSLDGGWHELTTSLAKAGSLYRYILPDGTRVPDPASRFQPMDVNGPSQVIDPLAFGWDSWAWKGRPWEQAVLYELHIGTFTQQGTFRAAIEKLDYLASLGITAIEIMSIGDFPGAWGWGYDSVLLYAPDSSYGTPDDLKAFIDAAHTRGLMVILDVVYNHFGPEGNYIPRFFPDIFTDRYVTPWGKALNFDSHNGRYTREFIILNALYWVQEFRMDGFRLDAVHAIIDSSSPHILDELAHRLRAVAPGREIHLILESDDTMWHRLVRDTDDIPLFSTAQWNHDSKQLAHLGLSIGRSEAEELRDTELLGRALMEGFTSEPPKFGSGHDRAEMPARISPLGFIAFLQTHDLIGNRIRGERISHIARPEVLRALSSIYLLLPQIPMLFMGEEWACSRPFPYFCDFRGDLADAVRRGRLEQFTSQRQREDPAYLATIPDPLDERTFLSAKLNWEELAQEPHASALSHYRTLLELRHRTIIPLLRCLADKQGRCSVQGPRALEAHWDLDHGGLRLDANLSDHVSAPFSPLDGDTLWLQGTTVSDTQLGSWSVRWSLHD